MNIALGPVESIHSSLHCLYDWHALTNEV